MLENDLNKFEIVTKVTIQKPRKRKQFQKRIFFFFTVKHGKKLENLKVKRRKRNFSHKKYNKNLTRKYSSVKLIFKISFNSLNKIIFVRFLMTW